MQWSGSRISIRYDAAGAEAPAMDVALLGHCPGDVAPQRIGERARRVMRRSGFELEVACLEGSAAACAKLGDETARVRELFHVPVPVHSVGEFREVFPGAMAETQAYRSRLAGAIAWLPAAIEDYFANTTARLWVVRIPEAEGQRGFLPRLPIVLHESAGLRGLACVLPIQELGLVAFPDLERVQIPADLGQPERKRLANPEPAFLPCTTRLDDTHRERRSAEEMEALPRPFPLDTLLKPIGEALARHRPDVQCLFTLPLGRWLVRGEPALDPSALESLETIKQEPGNGTRLRRVQLVFPYLQGPNRPIVTSVGHLAGMQAATATRLGSWRSMAGVALPTQARPYPAVGPVKTSRLREGPGIGVLRFSRGSTVLDDERLAVPALPLADYEGADVERYDSHRSGEVARFIGHLMRRLQALGELLIFNVDVNDPRPGMLLQEFFLRLHRQGALRGARAENAFSIRRAAAREGALAFEIEVAPAFPIDRIHLLFSNRSGHWQAEMARE
jgi:hypothetical protein